MSNKPIHPLAPRISKEVAALDAHLALINSIPQVGLPPTTSEALDALASEATVVPTDAPTPNPEQPWINTAAGIPNPETMPFTPEPLQSGPSPFIDDTPPVRSQKLFFTGRLKSGKDYAAKAAGATIFGFADPLYVVATYYLGRTVSATEGKDLDGVRAFLQTVGQWGRGVISKDYPLSPTRALFQQQLMRDFHDGVFGGTEVDWESYGQNPNIWLDSCLLRADAFIAANPGARVAITNCRFENEFKRLQADGFEHFHCMCGPKTWAARLAESKLTPESSSVRDTSEQLAAKLDQSVIKQLNAQKTGPMLKAIWSDPTAPKPSPRLHSVESFLHTLGGAR